MKIETKYYTKEGYKRGRSGNVIYSTKRQAKKTLRQRYHIKSGRQWKKFLRIPSFEKMFRDMVDYHNYNLKEKKV